MNLKEFESKYGKMGFFRTQTYGLGLNGAGSLTDGLFFVRNKNRIWFVMYNGDCTKIEKFISKDKNHQETNKLVTYNIKFVDTDGRDREIKCYCEAKHEKSNDTIFDLILKDFGVSKF